VIFFTEKQVKKIHSILINKTGGLDGVREDNLLDSALKSPFQTFDSKELYPEIIDKAAQLCYSMVENHPFIDGNKRIGVHLMLIFLELNNVKINYTQKELIDFGLGIASGKISRDGIKEWIFVRK
jgi:death-on-curing protein